jgi:hypothetical protein
MLKELFGFSDLLDVPVFVMLFFMLIFGTVLVRILSRRRSPHYEAMAQLPLESMEPATRETELEVEL